MVADSDQSGERPLERPAFLGNTPFVPMSEQPLPAAMESDTGPGDDSKPLHRTTLLSVDGLGVVVVDLTRRATCVYLSMCVSASC